MKLVRQLIFGAGLIGLLLIIAACSENPRKSSGSATKPQALLITKDVGNGIQLFTYTAQLQDGKIQPIRQMPTEQRGAAQQTADQKKDSVMRRFEKIMRDDPRIIEYCPSGIYIIEKHFVNKVMTIRGECK